MGVTTSSPSSRTVPAPGSSVQGGPFSGDILIWIRYPSEAEGSGFNRQNFRYLLGELQKNFPRHNFSLQCHKTEDFCEHAMFYNSSDPSIKQRVRVEVHYTQSSPNYEDITQLIKNTLDPEKLTHINMRFGHTNNLMQYVTAHDGLRL